MRIALLSLVILLLGPLPLKAQVRSSPRNKTAISPSTKSNVQELPLRRVVLYSNGVAFFERRGIVSGNAEITLQFKQSQVNDVLKSMVVLDLGGGQIGTVHYNSSAPPSALLSEIPFSIEAASQGDSEGGFAGVLRQFQGARVAVSTAEGTLTGSVLTISEHHEQPDTTRTTLKTFKLVVATESGEVASFDLQKVRSVRLLDAGARGDLAEFANASASARRRDAKTIVITTNGVGQRELSVSYTIASPIWKTTYRVVLDSTGSPFFQGWAIVDNVGDEDWQNISLSLVSGTPVSFIHQLQQPLYRYRRVIPIPEDLNLDPQIYEATGGGYGIGGGRGGNLGGGDSIVGGGGVGGGGGGSINQSAGPSDSPVTTLSDALSGEDVGIKTASTGNEVGDLFEYRLDQPVTVQRDRSALIPILQTRMEGQRVSIYREADNAERPMSGLLLKNTSRLTLEAGSLTVIEGDAYAGESLIERLKPGEPRFISFAVDLTTLVRVRTGKGREPVFLVRVVDGTFQAHYHNSESKTYEITNQSDKPRVVYVEHPLRSNWNLTENSPRPVEKTQNFYRFRVELKPAETASLTISERQALMDTYAVSNLSARNLEVFISRGYLDESSRKALEAIIEAKSQISEIGLAIEEFDQEISQIAVDQSRLRENIKVLGQNSEAKKLIGRYLSKANEQESRIDHLNLERRTKAAQLLELKSRLDSLIRTLALDRRLVAEKQE